jgi:predicted PurR-regulated permease PerM
MADHRRDLTQTTLAVMSVAGLFLGSLWILQPFIPAIIWAITLVVATWPVMLGVQRYTGGRRGVAVTVMTLALLILLVAPLSLAIEKIIENTEQIGAFVHLALSFQLPAPPSWLADVPLVGEQAAKGWQDVGAMGVDELAPRLTPYAGAVTRWFVSSLGSIGGMLVQFLLTVAVAAVLYSNGEYAARTALRFGHRLGGARGESAVRLAGGAVRGIALGVVVTAIAQSALGGIGLMVDGVPFAALLTALMFILCLAQIGPTLVLLPAVAWLFWSGATVRGTMMAAFSIVVISLDNFLRPVLIRRGAALPVLLILAGVLGGLLTVGLLGIFIGPTVLAVAFTLLMAWIESDDTVPPA